MERPASRLRLKRVERPSSLGWRNLEETEKSGIINPRSLPIETEKSGAPFLPRSENLEETEKSGIIIGRGLPIETEKEWSALPPSVGEPRGD